MQYNPQHYVVAANDLILGRSSLTLQEARIVRLLITQIAQRDIALRPYQCRITDLARFLDISPDNIYRDVRRICRSLIKREIAIETDDPRQPWKYIQWIQLAEYDGAGTITLMLSEQLKPYVLELSRWFTRYPLGEILSMRSYYAIRLYELLRCHDGLYQDGSGALEFTVDYLRGFFACESKYKLNADFIINVIAAAEKEVNARTELAVSHVPVKHGRAISRLRFLLSPNYSRARKR